MSERTISDRPASEVRFMEQIILRRVATGISSRAMALAALGLGDTTDHDVPRDMGDWGRCLTTYEAAPPHLQQRMRPIMDNYARRLRQLGDEHGGRWRVEGLVWPVAS